MSSVISPTAGTRVDPIDSLTFVRGTTATFKATFISNGKPTKVDTGTKPIARILQPRFLDGGLTPSPTVLAEIEGDLVSGQEFEYKFDWDIPATITPLDNYVVTYSGQVASISYAFGDEYFAIEAGVGQVGLKEVGYATVSDIREKKFNIDQYLPRAIRDDLQKRDDLIQKHINDATIKLREELNLFKSRGNTVNNRLFVIYYSIWSILLASRGEDGSSVSESNLNFWREEWEDILAQEKRESSMQSIPIGRG